MADSFLEVKTIIEKIVLNTTRFYVPRLGKVSRIDDELKKGRILVHIPSLGWINDALGAWCYPKDKGSVITPRIDDYVLVEFIDGDKELPVYSGVAYQMKDMLPAAYDGKNTTQILFENNSRDFAIIYDEAEKLLKLGSMKSSESYVLGNTLKTELQKVYDALNQLKSDFSSWVPVPNDGGAALKAVLSAGFLTKLLGDLNSILSEKIKGE